MTGLKRGTVQLISHQEEWDEKANNMIQVYLAVYKAAGRKMRNIFGYFVSHPSHALAAWLRKNMIQQAV